MIFLLFQSLKFFIIWQFHVHIDKKKIKFIPSVQGQSHGEGGGVKVQTPYIFS